MFKDSAQWDKHRDEMLEQVRRAGKRLAGAARKKLAGAAGKKLAGAARTSRERKQGDRTRLKAGL